MAKPKTAVPTICHTCGAAMLTYYPNRKPHVCHRCRVDHQCYMPTAEEIAAACEEIQAGWNETERESHSVAKHEAVELTVWHPTW